MKNFKKVISSVIALAIAASSFAAVSASSFSDVADTASYAEAVDVLAALGIVTGYEEDGQFTFKPEGNITRAEAATMIVGALNMTEEAKNASATCQFADVNEKASWAAGYVNVGVSEGFISGRSENEFDPQANVTYAEMCVMTTKLTGYADYATSNIKEGDPWYKCYTDMAASAGLNKGVSVPLTSALTRGHVAQMIYNALVTPKLGITSYSFTDNRYAPLDGGENGQGEFKTLLSEKFDGYVVTASILATAKSAAIDKGTVSLQITKAPHWDGDDVVNSEPASYVTLPKVEVIGIEDIDNQLLQSGTAVLLVDELDDVDMVYFKANTKVETKEFSAEDYVPQNKRGTGKNFAALANADKSVMFGTSSYVKVKGPAVAATATTAAQPGTKLYINGAEYTADLAGLTNADAVLDKFLSNAQGKITFAKVDRNQNLFDTIFVDYYVVGEVSGVSYKSEKTTVRVKVVDDIANGTVAPLKGTYEIVISDEAVADDECDITVSKNDTEIELKDLAKGDVIAFAVDFSSTGAIDASNKIVDPKFIKVLATDEIVKGMVLDYDDEVGTYTIGENTYKYVGFNFASSATRELGVSKTYELMLDPFGRILDEGETIATTEKYAILEKYDANLDKVTLLLADGSTASYEVHSSSSVKIGGTTVTIGDILTGAPTTSSISRPTVPVQNRVVGYTVSNNAVKLTQKTVDSAILMKEYNTNTNKLGAVTVTEGVKFINAEDYVDAGVGAGKITDYAKFDVSELKADTEYTAYAYKSGDLYSFVIITSVGTTFTADSRFAVITKKPGAVMMNDESVIGATALYKGEEITLYWDVQTPKHADNSVVAAGDAFFFTTDSDGFVDASYKIYNKNKTNTISSLVTGLDGSGNPLAGSLWSSGDLNTADWAFNTFADSTADIYLVEGIVTQVKSNAITFGVESSVTTVNGTYSPAVDGNVYEDPAGATGMFTFGIAENCNAYEYDADPNYTGRDVERYQIVEASSINESDLTEYTYGPNQEEEEYVYNVTLDNPATTTVNEQVSASINRAVALVVDGDVVCIYNIAE